MANRLFLLFIFARSFVDTRPSSREGYGQELGEGRGLDYGFEEFDEPPAKPVLVTRDASPIFDYATSSLYLNPTSTTIIEHFSWGPYPDSWDYATSSLYLNPPDHPLGLRDLEKRNLVGEPYLVTSGPHLETAEPSLLIGNSWAIMNSETVTSTSNPGSSIQPTSTGSHVSSTGIRSVFSEPNTGTRTFHQGSSGTHHSTTARATTHHRSSLTMDHSSQHHTLSRATIHHRSSLTMESSSHRSTPSRASTHRRSSLTTGSSSIPHSSAHISTLGVTSTFTPAATGPWVAPLTTTYSF
ncbi:MAG: hypothetical protein M1820_001278 [Bogoriella megaspora]|nr:MAG: hypothetical protein M1820_001278 [Bogoriella megaspora]